MQNKFLNYLLLSAILLISISNQGISQKSNLQLYKSSLKKLKKNKAVEKNRAILIQATRGIIKTEQEEVNVLLQTGDLADAEKAIQKLDFLQRKIRDAQSYTENEFDAVDQQIIDDFNHLHSSVAVGYFEKAGEFLQGFKQSKEKALARKAYANYLKAEEYDHPSPDIEALKSESHQSGIVYYSITAHNPFELMQNWEISNHLDDMLGSANTFLVVDLPENLPIAKVDCEIELNFASIDFDQNEQKEETNFTKEVVTGTTTVTNDDGEEEEVDVLEEVSAIVSMTKFEKLAEWRMNISIHKSTKNCPLAGHIFEEELLSEAMETSINGDERAVPEEYLYAENTELMDDDDMAEILLANLFSSLYRYLF